MNDPETINEVQLDERDDLPELIVCVKSLAFDSLIIVLMITIFSTLFDLLEYEGETLRKYAYFALLLYEPLFVALGATIGHRLMKTRVRKSSDESKNVFFPLAFVRYI